jgi:hypothetical protein
MLRAPHPGSYELHFAASCSLAGGLRLAAVISRKARWSLGLQYRHPDLRGDQPTQSMVLVRCSGRDHPYVHMYMHVRKGGHWASIPADGRLPGLSQPVPTIAIDGSCPVRSLALVTMNGLGRSIRTPEAILSYSRVAMRPRSTG